MRSSRWSSSSAWAQRDSAPQRACADASVSGYSGHPVADRPSVLARVQREADRAYDFTVDRDRERALLGRTSPRTYASACSLVYGDGMRAATRRSPGRCSGDESTARRPPSTAAARDRRPGAPRGKFSPHRMVGLEVRGREAAAFRDLRDRNPALAGFRSAPKSGRRPTLPGACAPSTIGAGGLNFSVRNGKRCTPAAMTAQIVEVPALRSWPHAHPQNSIAAFDVFEVKTSGN